MLTTSTNHAFLNCWKLDAIRFTGLGKPPPLFTSLKCTLPVLLPFLNLTLKGRQLSDIALPIERIICLM